VEASVSSVESPATDTLPLCVDLDGTLLRIDSLHEATVEAMQRDWRVSFRLVRWLSSGKAELKQHVAEVAATDPALLPYNEQLVEWLRAEKARGRSIVLATASDRRLANAVAAHLGLFHAVIASHDGTNLKGAAKAQRLADRFGERGFCYVGNDAADLAVWRRAGGAVVVNAAPAIVRQARKAAPLERVFPREGNWLRALVRAMRLYQWVKNLLVFVAPLAAHSLLDSGTLLPVVAIFLAFGLTASGIYLLNDIADLRADRSHPRKRNRPFASGELPVAYGLVAGPLLVLAGLITAVVTSQFALAVLLVYAVGSIAYTVELKKKPLVDVFLLAALYTIRVVAGSAAVGVLPSQWLLSASAFFFLGLAFLKRYVELAGPRETGANDLSRRGYLSEDAAVLQTMGICSGFISCLVLALYVSSEPALQLYAQPGVLWGVVPLVAFWVCRLWLSGMRGYVHDDPIIYAARDWVSWCVMACMAILGAVATIRFSAW
jgi:4-hydroxybenzoate polyprenyltransferase/phosphoserine phosphatase